METLAIESLAVQVRGVSYKPEDLHSSLDDSSVILLRANNIDDGIINFDDVVFVDKMRVSNEQFLRKGDILVCASSGSKNLVGKAASVDFDKEVTFGAFCKVVRPRNIEDADYLAMFFQSPIYRHQIATTAIGANINNIRNEHIDTLSVNWPDTAKRKEIVDILSKAEAIIRIRKKQLTALDDLIKARFVEMFGDPEHNSKSWSVQALDMLCTVGSSKRIYQNEQSSDGVPFWRISDLVNRMDSGVADSGLFIPEEKYIELKQAGLVPSAGDILVTSRGTLGRCYIIEKEDRFYFQDGMISWLYDYCDSITPLYLKYLFTMPGFRKQIDSMQAGSTVAYLSIAMLKKLRVMVPSRAAQDSFATFVAQIDKSKFVIQKSLDEAKTLFDSLMQQYFG